VQLLVALVEYKTNLQIPRRGLCSSWLDDLPEGTRIPLKVNPPTLFLPDPSIPLILVGPGTGVAPMRAFVEERVKQGAAESERRRAPTTKERSLMAGTILYFGCRSASSDLFYADAWDTYRQKGVRVEVAASRDQEEKLYVQHLIKRDAALIQEWIVDRGGYFFISGSSNAMPREVREAVAWCISQGGAHDEEAAKAYVDDMFDSGRGGEESW
jgi:sulfite reductase alpha subunit-like flavoprotein